MKIAIANYIFIFALKIIIIPIDENFPLNLQENLHMLNELMVNFNLILKNQNKYVKLNDILKFYHIIYSFILHIKKT